MNAMRNASDVTLNTIPKLKKTSLRFAFVSVSELKMENASMLENNDELSELKRRTDELIKKREEKNRKEEEEKRKREEEEKKRVEEEKRRVEEELRERKENGIVLNTEELNALPVNAKKLWVKKCEDYQNEVLDLSRFTELEELTIGDGCFNYVSKVSVVGLKKLKSVVIGAKSFQNESNDSELVVSDCPELVSLSVGNESFKGFREMKLSGLDGLKRVVMGGNCFEKAKFLIVGLKGIVKISLSSDDIDIFNKLESIRKKLFVNYYKKMLDFCVI